MISKDHQSIINYFGEEYLRGDPACEFARMNNSLIVLMDMRLHCDDAYNLVHDVFIQSFDKIPFIVDELLFKEY